MYLLTSFFICNSNVSYGYLEKVNFNSNTIGNRVIEIYSPKNWIIDDDTKFIIMQDGQMLFDSSLTWNNQEWMIDEGFKNRENLNFIIIGVHSLNKSGDGFFDNTKRYAEYFPKQSIDYFDKNIKTFIYKAFLDREKFNYLNFIVFELIPYIENKFSIKLNKNNTGIMGSSMGGLLALNAIIEYPDIFGFAGCFSVHWIGIKPIDYFFLPIRKIITEDENFIRGIRKYINLNITDLNSHKIYFDYGTDGLDLFYSIPQKSIDKIFIEHKINFISTEFAGHSHEEKYWALRFFDALNYLTQDES